MYPFSVLKFEMPRCHYVLFHTDPKTCKICLIRHMMTLVALKRSNGRFPEQLDFFRLESSIKIVLLEFFLLSEFSLEAGERRDSPSTSEFFTGYFSVLTWV